MSFPKEFRPINADAVADSIEQRQRKRTAPERLTKDQLEAFGKQIEREAAPYATVQRLAADVLAKRGDFEAAVAAGDMSLALGRFSWIDAQYRSTTQGGDVYNGIPPFSEAVDQAATKAVSARHKG